MRKFLQRNWRVYAVTYGTLVAVLVILLLADALWRMAHAEDPWENSPFKGWAHEQQVTERAKARFSCAPGGNCSCCEGADIVRTKFRVADDAGDAWDWLNPQTSQWERVPEDIIHWDEPTPTKEAVIFVFGGIPRCFYPPQDGGG